MPSLIHALGTWPRAQPLTHARSLRLAMAALLALVGGYLTWRAHADGSPSDFTLISTAARTWLGSGDPYELIGPGKAIDWTHPLLYPFTAVLVGVPFSLTAWPDLLFATAGAGAFGLAAWKRPYLWWAVPTTAWQFAVQMGQWAPFLVSASLFPWLGALLTCKPTIGLALWISRPTRKALISGLVFVAITVALFPGWPLGWLATLGETSHMQAPVQFWGGPLILAALWRWRQPEARLLAALACVPQTAHVYDTLPLFLIPRTHRQAATLSVLSWILFITIGPTFGAVDPQLTPQQRYLVTHQILGQSTVLLLYLPCLAMVLWPTPRPASKDPAPQ